MPRLLPLTYILPIRHEGPPDADLADYLHELVGWVADLVVVDGSPGDVFAEHERRWPTTLRHVRPEAETPNGKVGGVVTGLAIAGCDAVVVADDDVRWTQPALTEALRRLDAATAVVRPQNAFS